MVRIATHKTEQFQAIKAAPESAAEQAVRRAAAFSFSPPAIPGVGTSGGFTFVLEDRAGNDIPYLAANVDKFLSRRPQTPGNRGDQYVFPAERSAAVCRSGSRQSAQARRGDLTTSTAPLQAFHGRYIRQLLQPLRPPVAGLCAKPTATIEAPSENIGQFYVRNNTGAMVPLSALDQVRAAYSALSTPCTTTSIRSAQINGNAAPGYSSDQAMAALEQVFAQTMPQDMGYRLLGHVVPGRKLAEQGVSSATIFGISSAIRFPDSGGAV